jgi:nucleotide-binding universal stress UspA family protein
MIIEAATQTTITTCIQIQKRGMAADPNDRRRGLAPPATRGSVAGSRPPMIARVIESIVVGTDGSETAAEAVRQATELASAIGARIHLVSAYEPVPESRLRAERLEVPQDVQWMVNPREDVERLLEAEAESMRAAGVEVETLAREGDPADAILDIAEQRDADLVVVGNKGMTGAKRFLLGSVPNKVSHHAPCSVLIIRTS